MIDQSFPNGPGVSRPPPTRLPMVKNDAQLRQLGGSAARRVGRHFPAFTQQTVAFISLSVARIQATCDERSPAGRGWRNVWHSG